MRSCLIRTCVLPAMILSLLIGCIVSKNMGRYQSSNEVGRIFKSYQVVPDHTYYFAGSNVDPFAIIAIDNRYTLTSANLWTKANIDKKQLGFWVDTMSRKIGEMPLGFYILDPSGKRIGMFYSARSSGPVEMEGDNKVSVYLPDEEEENLREPLLP